MFSHSERDLAEVHDEYVKTTDCGLLVVSVAPAVLGLNWTCHLWVIALVYDLFSPEK